MLLQRLDKQTLAELDDGSSRTRKWDEREEREGDSKKESRMLRLLFLDDWLESVGFSLVSFVNLSFSLTTEMMR